MDRLKNLKLPSKGPDNKYHEVLKRVDSMMGVMVSTFNNLTEKIAVTNNRIDLLSDLIQLKVAVKVETLTTLLFEKNVLDSKEFAGLFNKINDELTKLREDLQDKAEGLVVVQEPFGHSCVAIVKVNVVDNADGNVLDRDAIIPVYNDGKDRYVISQMIKLIDDMQGKRAGETGSFSHTVPNDEANNPYTGKTLGVTYEIIKIKAQVKPESEAPHVIH